MPRMQGSFAVGICVVVLIGCSSTKRTGANALNAETDAGRADAGHGQGSNASDASIESGTPSTPKITPLADNSAGKACTNDATCGGGSCGMAIMSSGGGIGALLGGGTTVPTPGGYCTGPCLTDTDCGAGGVCVGAGGGLAGLIGGLTGGTTTMTPGQCQAACSQSSDCRDGYSCGAYMVPIPDGGAAMPGGGLGNLIGMLGGGATATTCQPLPANDQLGAHVAGAACSSDTDCMGGSCSTSMGGGGLPGAAAISYPGGYCSGLCLTSDNCGAGGVCSPPMGGAGAGNCFKSCASDSDCTRDGYRCRDLGSGLKGCNPAPKPLPDHVVGKACSNDDACGAGMGTCVTVLPGASAMTGGFFGGAAATPDPAPGGYCSNQCASDADCGAGGVCVGASMGGFTGTQVGTCFKGCSTSDDCRRDYGCELRGGAAALGGGAGTRTNVCVPIGGADAGD